MAVGRRGSFPSARLAMQKVEGSSPFIRSKKPAGNGGFSCCQDGGRIGRKWPRVSTWVSTFELRLTEIGVAGGFADPSVVPGRRGQRLP